MSRKKVGIITYHFARNYGAVLQCYALQKYLNEAGYDTDILNAVSQQQRKNNSLYNKKDGTKNLIYNICLFPFNYARRKKEAGFAEYVSNKIPCSYEVHNSEELEKLVNSGYDAIISGSDQVWNPHIFDFDPMFTFPFETKAKKIGYSVSIGEASYEDVKPYAEAIEQFDAVGLREHSSIETLKKLYSKPIVDTVDPVLLLTQQQWKQEAEEDKKAKIPNGKYLLCYLIDKGPVRKNLAIAEKIAKKRNLTIKVIWMHLSTPSFDYRFINDAGPMEFLRYMYHADAILTDGYHGTVFATLFNKELYSVINNLNSTDTRVKDYLTLLGLQDRLVYDSVEDAAICAIDYEPINQRIGEIPMPSKRFLSEQLSDI